MQASPQAIYTGKTVLNMQKLPKLLKEQKPSEIFINFITEKVNRNNIIFKQLQTEPDAFVECGQTKLVYFLEAAEHFAKCDCSKVEYYFASNGDLHVGALGHWVDKTKHPELKPPTDISIDPTKITIAKITGLDINDAEIQLYRLQIPLSFILKAIEHRQNNITPTNVYYSADFNGNLYYQNELNKYILITQKTQTKMETTNNDASTSSAAPLTFGQNAVGLTFNPAGDPAVTKCKQGFADLIDQMDAFRTREGATNDQKRHASIAITELESAQMRAVKALTSK